MVVEKSKAVFGQLREVHGGRAGSSRSDLHRLLVLKTTSALLQISPESPAGTSRACGQPRSYSGVARAPLWRGSTPKRRNEADRKESTSGRLIGRHLECARLGNERGANFRDPCRILRSLRPDSVGLAPWGAACPGQTPRTWGATSGRSPSEGVVGSGPPCRSRSPRRDCPDEQSCAAASTNTSPPCGRVKRSPAPANFGRCRRERLLTSAGLGPESAKLGAMPTGIHADLIGCGPGWGYIWAMTASERLF